MINKAMVGGHVGKDPDIRKSASGKKIASFTIATSEKWRDKETGERKEKTEWHRVAVFNEALVEIVEKYVKKGSKLFIEGKLRTRKWAGQDGRDNYTTEIVLENFNGQITLLDKREAGPPPADENSYAESKTVAPAGTAGKRDDMDDEIPF